MGNNIFEFLKRDRRFPDKIIEYKKVDSVSLKAHVFLPKNNDNNTVAPVMAFFFGGGWISGSPEQFYQQARFFSYYGVLAISFEYRTVDCRTSIIECIKDAKSAIRWIRHNAGTLQINPEQIIASGGSAGGYLAILTAAANGIEDNCENAEISSVPDFLVLFNPVLDTTSRGYGYETLKENSEILSPCYLIRACMPPTIIFHGKSDDVVPYENALRFTQLMKDFKNSCELISFEREGHGFFNGNWFNGQSDNQTFEATMIKTVQFLNDNRIIKI